MNKEEGKYEYGFCKKCTAYNKNMIAKLLLVIMTKYEGLTSSKHVIA